MNRLAPFLAARRRCRHPRPPAPPKRVEPRRWPPARRPGRKPTRGAPVAPGGGRVKKIHSDPGVSTARGEIFHVAI